MEKKLAQKIPQKTRTHQGLFECLATLFRVSVKVQFAFYRFKKNKTTIVI